MYKIAKMGALALAVAMSAPAFAADVAVPAGTQVAAHKRVHHRVRRASAKAAPAREWKQPARWVYMAKRMHAPKGNKWKGRWDDLGREGWELVSQEENLYIFKRPADFGWTPPSDTPTAATPADAVKKTKSAKKSAKKVH